MTQPVLACLVFLASGTGSNRGLTQKQKAIENLQKSSLRSRNPIKITEYKMDSETKLKQMQNKALACLGLAAVVFIGTLFLEPSFSIRLIKAGAEAAMVGGLADWFAVVALFRRPLGLPIPHTAIVPQSKDRIADKLAEFVKEKFLNPEKLTDLIRRSDPSQRFADWLSQPKNSGKIGRHAANLISNWLDLMDDRTIKGFIHDAMRTALGKMDFSRTLGSVLEMLTKGGRHQQLLDSAIEYIAKTLENQQIRTQLSESFTEAIKKELSFWQIVIPKEWASEKFTKIIYTNLNKILEEISQNPKHELREKFDDILKKIVIKLKTDPEFIAKGNEIKAYITNNEQIISYANSLWAELRTWLSSDLEHQSGTPSQIQQKIKTIGLSLGQKLAQDKELRDSINDHMENLATSAAPQFADFLTGHISGTVRDWNAKEMSEYIELSIGPDLQYIRISGTVVGGCIGVLLFLVSYAGEFLK